MVDTMARIASRIAFPLKYLPDKLTPGDKQTYLRELTKSRKMYKACPYGMRTLCKKGKYHTRKQVKSFKSKPSAHVRTAKKIYKVDTIGPTDALAKATGCSKESLAQIVRKGEGAYYSSGSRPNQTAQSWGIARLASAITSGKSAAVDYSILEEGCASDSIALKLAKKAVKKHGHGTRRVRRAKLSN